MADSKNKSDNLWLLVILIVLLGLWFSSPVAKENNQSVSSIISDAEIFPIEKKQNDFSDQGYTPENTPNLSEIKNSPNNSSKSEFSEIIRLGLGNVKSEIQINRQYIIIENRGSRNSSPVNISGWTLKNNRGEKMYNLNGQVYKTKSDSIKIPSSGVVYYNPYKTTNKKSSLILDPGDRAIVLTGKVANISPVVIQDNFRVNVCMSYIENLSNYNFYPSLRNNCPDERKSINFYIIDELCENFIKRLPRCVEPEFSNNGCINKICGLTSFCRSIVLEKFNYNYCFDNHKNEDDFLVKEWRIFLNYRGSLWDQDRATIYLYDSTGKLVDQLDY